MAYTESTGTQNLRAQEIDGTIRNIADKTYKFKQILTIKSTSAYKNVFFREDPSVLTNATGNSMSAIPRGANFPQATVAYQQFTVYIDQFGLEENLNWVDLKTDSIGLLQRASIKIGEGIAAAVDNKIWSGISTDTSVSSGAASSPWVASSAAIFRDIGQAIQSFELNYIPTNNVVCVISPYSKANVLGWVTDKGAQWQSLSTDTVVNGSIGKVNGVTFIVTPAITASRAFVAVPNRFGSWVSAQELVSTTVEDPYRSTKIRGTEMGALEVNDPLAGYIINGV